jgi:hypothetical protein
MGIRITYHCPHCRTEIRSPLLKPPTGLSALCGNCGGLVRRTLGSIISDWQVSLFVYGYLPVWLLLTLIDPLGYRQDKTMTANPWLSTALIYFFATLFVAAIGGGALGKVVGTAVYLLATSGARRPSGGRQ